MKTQKRLLGYLLFFLMFLGWQATANAQLLFEENFDYTPGQLDANGGGANVSGGNWVYYSGTTNFIMVTSGSLSYTGYASSGIGNKVDLTYGSAEDVYRQFTTQSGDYTLYTSALINVTQTTGLLANASTTGDYTISFLPSTSTTILVGRISLRAGSVANTFNIGLRATSSNTAAVWMSTDFPVGTPILVVMSYQSIAGNANDVASLWVNPALGGSAPTADLTQTSTLSSEPSDLARISLRQGTNSFPGQIDGMRVGLSWAAVAVSSSLTPTATFVPTNAATNVAINSNITITFDQAVRNIDDSPISDPASLLTLKLNDAAGATVPFTATIDATNKIFTIDPTSDLANNQLYYVAIASVENATNDATTTLSSTFTTIGTDFSAPVVDTAYATSLNEVWVVFDEPVTITAENTANYTGLPGIASAVRVATQDSVKLTLSSPLTFGIPDTVCVNNISDIPGNVMTVSDCHKVQFGILDVIPPVALSAWVVDLSTVKVKFNESVSSSAEVTSHYTGLAGVSTAVRNATNDTVTLSLSPSLISGISDTLYVTGIQDIAGNPMTQVYEFSLYKDTSTTPIHWVITEIMYNPPESGIDSLEFIEIYNNGTTTANFRNHVLKFGSTTYTHHTDLMVNVGEYALFGIYASKAAAFYGKTFVQGPSTGISNGGTTVKILSPLNVLIDSVPYTNAAPWPTEANGNGYSLSLCDPNSDNSQAANWSLGSIAFGTINGKVVYANPGEGCSPAVDTVAPIATSALASNFTTVKVRFNEEVNISAQVTANYTGIGTVSSAVLNTLKDTVTLTLATPLVSGIADTLYVTAIEDLSGNAMDTTYQFVILLDTSTTAANVVITEIMYNSPESGTDTLEFIEVYNNGSSPVDLMNYDVYFGTSYANIGVSVPLAPGAYAVITNKVAQVNAFYGVSAIQGPLGALTNTGSVVKLLNANGLLVDSLTYGVSAPWPTTPNGGGASLTLCDPDADNTVGSNWSASSHLVGVINGINVNADPGTSCVVIDNIDGTKTASVRIYPNPANEMLTIELGSAVNREVSLYTLTGNKVQSWKTVSDRLTIAVSSLSQGVYILQVTNNDGQSSMHRVIISK